MNLDDLITRYIAFRRALGERCRTNEFILRSFCRAVGPRTRASCIRAKDVATFLASFGPITNAWHVRHSALKGCFEFAVSHGLFSKIPLPTDLPSRLPTLTPYIYSREELRRLLDAMPSFRHYPRRIEAPTLRAIVLTAYGAGLRRKELLDLLLSDVDIPNSMLTIRDSKFSKSRLVPIGKDLTQVLSDHAEWRAARHPGVRVGSHFFFDRDGMPLTWWPLHHAFYRLREFVGIRRSDGGRYQPRFHDLRHTFAVHHLMEWYRQGADVQRLIYHLSVYLGHVSLEATQVYLTMTPELLQQASIRFEQYAQLEDDHA